MGKGFEQTFLPRRYTNGQHVYEKMFSITNHQRNAQIKTKMRYIILYPLKWSEVTQSCPTLCDPMDYIACLCPWVSQARILEWVAISFSRGSSCPKDQTRLFHLLNWQVDFFYPLANSSLMLFVKCELGGSELCSTLLWIVRKKDVVSYHELGGREEHKWCEQPGLLPPVPSPSCHHHHPNNWCRYWGLTMGQDRNLSLYMCYLTTLSQLCKVEGIVSPHFWIETVTRQLAQCPS